MQRKLRFLYLKFKVVLFKAVLINLLGFDLLVWRVGLVLGQFCGDMLQLGLMRLQLLLLQYHKDRSELKLQLQSRYLEIYTHI